MVCEDYMCEQNVLFRPLTSDPWAVACRPVGCGFLLHLRAGLKSWSVLLVWPLHFTEGSPGGW